MAYDTLELWGHGGPPTERLLLYSHGDYKKYDAYSLESRALQQCKNDIDHFYVAGKWDDYKKITNPYEYIFLSWNRRSLRSVATRQPLSRSYFKMIEMWKRAEFTEYLQDLVERDGGLVTAHSAEGPGGFIEACAIMAERNEWAFKSASAITLQSEAKNVPGWRKAYKFLTSYPQVAIHNGADKTGNILIKMNQDAFVGDVRSAYPEGVHVYTADGGFDFSNDYNAQEDMILPLLIAEIIIGLRVLSRGGCLVIKCFDTTEQATLDLLWLTSRAFHTWGVVKPRTSRAGNAERYIIGKGFLGDAADILEVLTAYQAAATFTLPILAPSVGPPKATIDELLELQARIEHMELFVIRETLDLIRHTDIGVIRCLVRQNVGRSMEWCKEHGEEISRHWLEEQERFIYREASDLQHILNPSPTNYISYSGSNSSSWRITSTVSFDGFRSGTLLPTPPENNPFLRKGFRRIGVS